MPIPRNLEDEDLALKIRRRGVTLAGVGKEMGLSTERARALILRAEARERAQGIQPPLSPYEDKKSGRFVSPMEFAEFYGFGRSLVYKAIHDGTLPALKLGGRYVIDRAQAEAILRKAAQDHSGVSEDP